ncbi:MAG: TonB-dependent receptor plug domain-containing protein [Proteobacteria bacterium]|nr:TonB-dependent receptor plug domain-containing protein [Pseudomonadota bacterium]
MINRCIRVALLMLVFATSAATSAQQNSQQGGDDDSTITYSADYFQQFSPVSVSDMLDRIPGIGLVLNDNQGGFDLGAVRGLGGSSNILIDGKRLAGKANEAQSQLNQIAASEVAYIEIIRASSSDLDVQNTGQVVNIVLKQANSRSNLSFQAGLQSYQDHTVEPLGLLALTGSRGRLNYLVSASAVSGYDYQESFELSLHRDLGFNEIVELERTREQTIYTLTSNFTYDLNVRDRIAFNALYGKNDPPSSLLRKITDFNSIPPTTSFEREIIPSTSTNWELGGDYEHKFAANAKYKFLFIVNDKKAETTRERYQFDDLGEEENKNLFLNNSSRYRENIIRTSYTWNVAAGQGLELGFEAARTIQDTDLKLGLPVSGQASPQFGDLVPVPLPNAVSTVEEIRYEGFAVHNWKISARMSLESSLIAEFSEIEQTGDISNQREFNFIKPKFDFRFDVSNALQLRATVEKVVSQLSFADFSAAINERDEDQDTIAGNPQLEPEESWRYTLRLDYRLPDDGGVLNARLFYYEIENVNGRIDISQQADPLESSNGNVGTGSVLGLNLNASIRFGFIGLPQALLTAGLLVQDSAVHDPLIGFERKVVPFDRGSFRLGFRHDVPTLGLNYGFDYDDRIDGNRTLFDINNVLYLGSGSNLTLFIEKTFAGLTYRFELINALDHENKRERRRYEGYLRDDVLSEIERFATRSGPSFVFKLRGTF